MGPTSKSHSVIPRTSQRFSIDLPVEFRLQSGKSTEGRIKNVSVGGMFLESPKALSSGQKSFFRLQLRPNSLQFHLEGEVVWTQKNKMGIRFLIDPRQNEKMLEGLVLALKEFASSSLVSPS